ncbi:hypothetical protein Tco_1497766, partial [Tanacetum coccineum]
NPQESFAELPLYCHNLKLKNQETITHIETDDEDRFEIFFLAIGAVLGWPLERISKKRTKNEAKTTKPDTEWKNVEKTKSRQSPS